MTAKAKERTQKLNGKGTDTIPLTEEDIAFRKENRRHKITPKYSKHTDR